MNILFKYFLPKYQNKDIINLYAWLMGLSLFTIGVTLALAFQVTNLNEKIKDAPHKVCVNETITYGNNQTIVCKRYIIGQFSTREECLPEVQRIEVKEVCKWVDAEGNELK